MIIVDGRNVLVVRLETTANHDVLQATAKSALLRESTGRVMFVESGPADLHVAIANGELRVDGAGIRDRFDLPADDDLVAIDALFGRLARRLNQEPLAAS